MKKTALRWTALLLLGVLLLAACVGCGKSYAGDDRIGKYTDPLFGTYSFELRSNGNGTFTYHSSVEGDITEDIFFEITEEGMLLINGTAKDGKSIAIGRNEYRGTLEKDEDGKYVVVLRNSDTGVPLGSFRQVR